MELVLAVVIVVMLALFVREHLAARGLRQRTDAVISSLRAEVAAAEERAEEAEHHERQLEEQLSSASVGRAKAEAEMARTATTADERVAEADRKREEAVAEAAAATADRKRLEAQLATAREEADERVAAAVAEAEERAAKASAEAEERLTAAEERAAKASAEAEERLAAAVAEAEARVPAPSGAGTGEEGEVVDVTDRQRPEPVARREDETGVGLAAVLDGSADESLASALWEMELARIDRAWRAAIAPMANVGPRTTTSTGADLTTAIAHELERAREEVGVTTELFGRLDAPMEPLVALVALRAVQELVAETIRCCTSVEVTFDAGDQVAVTIAGEGCTGSVPETGPAEALVAVVAGAVSARSDGEGAVTAEVRVPAAREAATDAV